MSQQKSSGLVWKIALGVLGGLVLWQLASIGWAQLQYALAPCDHPRSKGEEILCTTKKLTEDLKRMQNGN